MSLPSSTIPGARTAEGRQRHRDATATAVSYDFRRPIQLSREHQRVLQGGFDGFARQSTNVFTSVLRRICSVSLINIDQRTYGEYVTSLGPSAYMTLFSIDPMLGTGVLTMPLSAVMSCVDHMLGGPGHPDQPQRPLTEIESGVISGLVARLLHEMRYSLESTIPIEPELVGVEYNPQFAQVAASADVMVAIALELRIDEQSYPMSVCLPFAGLHPHLASAAAPMPVSQRERTQRDAAAEVLGRRFHDVPVDVSVRFRTTRVAPEVLVDLEPGQVIRLGHPATAPLDITVGEQAFAHATAGTQGARLAAQIVAGPPSAPSPHPAP